MEIRFDHQLLDWRMGVDLLAYLDGEEPVISLKGAHWTPILDTRIRKRLSDYNWEITKEDYIDNFKIFYLNTRKGNFAVVPIHPLVNYKSLDVIQKEEELSEIAGIPIVFTSPYDLERFPLSESQRIANEFVSKVE